MLFFAVIVFFIINTEFNAVLFCLAVAAVITFIVLVQDDAKALMVLSQATEFLFNISVVVIIGSFVAFFVVDESKTDICAIVFLGSIFAAVISSNINNSLIDCALEAEKNQRTTTKLTQYAKATKNHKSKKETNEVIWSGKEKISFSYINAKNEHSERTINLHEIVFRGDDYLLKGYCYMRRQVRWFVSGGIVSDITYKGEDYNPFEFIQKCTDFEL